MSTKNNSQIHLPHLPLDEQTTRITQEVADQIIDHLVKHYPERMDKVLMYERGDADGNTVMAYAEAMQPVINDVSKIMDTPDSELGYIELNFELVRRCRAYRGYEPPEVKGKPLAPSIDGPYPERLVDKPIFNSAVLDAGFTQEQVDVWCDEFYQNNKSTCFQKAEATRRDVAFFYLAKRDPILVYFRQKAEETGDENIIRHYSKAANELNARISVACELFTLEWFRNRDEQWNKNREKWKKS